MMPSPSAGTGRKRKEAPSSQTEETDSNTTEDAKLASGLYKKAPGGQLKKLCSVEGCENQARNEGVCTKHGAKRTICSHEGCENQAQNSGVCYSHGAKRITCSHEGCGNKVVNSGVCIAHGAKKTICSHEGCENQARRGGVCARHGAKMATCSYEGCEKQAQNSGVCFKHGAKRANRNRRICSYEGCTKYAQSKGVCCRHGATQFIKKRKSTAVVSDNEDDTNDNQQRRTTRRRTKPPTTPTEAQNNGSISIDNEVKQYRTWLTNGRPNSLVNLDHTGSNTGTESTEMNEDNEDDNNNDNNQQRQTRRRIKPPVSSSNNGTEEIEMNESVLEEDNLQPLVPQLPQNRQAIDNSTDQSASSIINDNTDSVGEDIRITHVGEDWDSDENDDIDFEQDTVTTNNEQQPSNLLVSHLATDATNYLCVSVSIDDNNERNEMEKRSCSMKYLFATVAVMMICGRTFYSPKNDGWSLPPITIVVGIDDGTDSSSWSSHPSAEVSSPALSIKNQSFINHSPDATSSTTGRDDEVNGVETSDMYSKALVVHHKSMSHLNHEAQVKSGVEEISIAWEKHEVESRADVFYQSQSFLDISDTSIKGPTIKDSRSISNTTTDTSSDKDRIFDKKQVDKRISMPDVFDDIDMVRNSKQDENVTPELKSSFPGQSLIATVCLLVISICRRILMQQEARLATSKAKVAVSIQRLCRGRSGRKKARLLASKVKIAVNMQCLSRGIAGRNRSLAAAKVKVALNIQRRFRGIAGRNTAKLQAAKVKVAVNMQRLFRGRAIRMEPPGIIWSSLEQQGFTTARAEGMGDDSTISTHFTWNTLSYQSSETQLSNRSNEKYTRREDVSRSGNGLDIHVLQTAKALRADVIQTQEQCTSELIHGQEEIKLGQKKIMDMIQLTLVDGSKNLSEKIDSVTGPSRPRPPINLHKILAQEARQRHKQMFGGDLS